MASERTSTCELLFRHTDTHAQEEERNFPLNIFLQPKVGVGNTVNLPLSCVSKER